MQEDLQDDDDQEDDEEGIVEGQLELNSHDRRDAPPASPPRTTLYVTTLPQVKLQLIKVLQSQQRP